MLFIGVKNDITRLKLHTESNNVDSVAGIQSKNNFFMRRSIKKLFNTVPGALHSSFLVTVNPISYLSGKPVAAPAFTAGREVHVIVVKSIDYLPRYQRVAGIIEIDRQPAVMFVFQ
jgi:hypothetical protein